MAEPSVGSSITGMGMSSMEVFELCVSRPVSNLDWCELMLVPPVLVPAISGMCRIFAV